MKDYGWLQNDVVTAAWCWRLVLKNGTSFGFTSHDEDITYKGVTYTAATGFSPTSVDGNSDLSTDNLDASGVITSDLITADDIKAGLYAGAQVSVFLVDYADTTHDALILRSGTIGAIDSGEQLFKATVEGLTVRLQQTTSKVYQKTCRASFGDNDCAINNISSFERCSFANAFFDGTQIAGASFKQCDFKGTVLNTAGNLSAANSFIGCDMRESVLANVTDPQYPLNDATFTNCNMRNATIGRAFKDCYYSNCDFTEASFNALETNFLEGGFDSCLFRRTTMDKAKLTRNAANYAGLYFNTRKIENCIFDNVEIFNKCDTSYKKNDGTTALVDTTTNVPSSYADIINSAVIENSLITNCVLNVNTLDYITFKDCEIDSLTTMKGYWWTRFINSAKELELVISSTNRNTPGSDADENERLLATYRATNGSYHGNAVSYGVSVTITKPVLQTTPIQINVNVDVPVTDTVYRNKDFSAHSISNQNFTRCTFINCIFDGMRIETMTFSLCTFSNCSFDGTSFPYVVFISQCTFTDCYLANTKWASISAISKQGVGVTWGSEGVRYVAGVTLTNKEFTISLADFTLNTYHGNGYCYFINGKNKDIGYEIKSATQNAAATVTITLAVPTMFPINVGDAVKITSGCDGNLSTCKNVYNNVLHFRGEPYIPGNDYMTSYVIPSNTTAEDITYTNTGDDINTIGVAGTIVAVDSVANTITTNLTNASGLFDGGTLQFGSSEATRYAVTNYANGVFIMNDTNVVTDEAFVGRMVYARQRS